MGKKYWLAPFSEKTWSVFLQNGAKIYGTKKNKEKKANQISIGDRFICYVTGESKFVGIFETTSKTYLDESPIWENDNYPVRFRVELVIRLSIDNGVDVKSLRESLSIFLKLKNPNRWTGFFQNTLALFTQEDAEIILGAIKKKC